MSSISKLTYGRLHNSFSQVYVNVFFFLLLNCLALGNDMSTLSFGTIKYKIKENQPPGLVVGNLLDNIPLKQYFISAKYHFDLRQESQEYFILKSGSSMLTTSKVIDLEAICSNDCQNGSKEFQLIAMIMRDRVFIQELRISVIIEDVNDNDPYFKQTFFEKSIKEIIYGPGKTINLPRAFDKDLSSVNNNIFYSLEEKSTYFRLNVTKDGQPNLIIETELDAETKDTHKLVLLAWNQNYPSRPSASLTITIFIDDMNDNEPRFSQPIYKVPIPENVELNHQIIQLKATDKDKTSKLHYSILPTAGQEIAKTFTISDDGVISLIKQLDYESNRFYSISVQVSDGEFTSKGNVEVVVIDVNDCSPQFTLNPENFVIPEGMAAQSILGHMNVIDHDSSYVDTGIECREPFSNQVMRFEVIETNNDRTKKINVYLNQHIDRDKPNGDKRFSTIICNDMGLNSRLTSTFTVTLTVLDTNDNAPLFSLTDYVVRIKENLRPRYKLTQVSATDKDAGVNAEIKYFISDYQHQQLFKINEQTGQIIGVQSLDREKQDYYQVIVLATDSAINEERHTSTATVHIHVIDVNDCVPKINETLNGFSVYENKPIGTMIGTLQATDCDIGKNGQFFFTLIPSAYFHFFELSMNGSLYTKVIFDRESLVSTNNPIKMFEEDGESKETYYRSQVKFCLRVAVRDVGEEVHLSSKTVVCIKILDENDNPPKLNIVQDIITAYNYTEINATDCSIIISKIEPTNSPIIPFTYFDADEGPNGQVELSIKVYPALSESHQLFYLNASEKSIKLKRQWQLQDGDKFLVTLIATDAGSPPKETTKVILVQFADIPPRFVDSTVSTASISNIKINVLIIIILVAISTVLTTTLIGAIVCMLQPCGNKHQNVNNRNGISRDTINSNLRIKSYPESCMVTSSIIDSVENDETEFKTSTNFQQNDYCKSEHHWTHEIDEGGRPINYYTLPPQILACTATTTHEEQRSDSGRGASDEDNPNYISTTDVFQYKPLYSIIPNVAYSSIVDAMHTVKPSIQKSLLTKPIHTPIPFECLSSSVNSEQAKNSCDDNFSFICTSTLPFYSISSYGQNMSLLQPTMTSVPEGDVNIPLINLDSYTSPNPNPTHLSSSSSNNVVNLSVCSSRNENPEDDMVNLSSHIDQLFFTKQPLRFQPFGKS